MPRDGLQQYHRPPGTDGVTNYTIESTKYNAFTADVEQDLNLPRPIVAGGTGASDAHTALINLHGEESGQLVSNYDSFPFVAGSFYSLPGATSEPVAGQYFSGICYVINANTMYLEGRASTSTTPQQMWVRSRFGGAWGTWQLQGGSAASNDTTYVNVIGDTMTGPLAITVKGSQIGINGGAAATSPVALADANLILYAATSTNWAGIGADGAGAMWFRTGLSGTPAPTLRLNTDQSAVFTGALSTIGNINVGAGGTIGTYYFGNTGTKYLQYDGTSFNLAGGPLAVSGQITGTRVAATNDIAVYNGAGTGGTVYFGNTITKYLTFDGTNFGFSSPVSFPQINVSLGVFGVSAWNPASPLSSETTTAATWPVAVKGNNRGIIYLTTAASAFYAYFTQGTTSNAVGSIDGTTTTTAYTTTSSGELKEDLKSFDAGNIIDETNVYDFAWKSTGERAYGVIAQQAIDVYPLAVTHVENVSKEIGEYWGVDYSKYVPVLLQELKALRARVRDLEGRLDTKPQPA